MIKKAVKLVNTSGWMTKVNRNSPNSLLTFKLMLMFPGKDMKCRYDWHQTATHITVAVYAKKYDFNVSYVEVSPVR